MPALVWWLTESPGDAMGVAGQLLATWPSAEPLEPLVPYLVNLLLDPNRQDQARRLLEQITGVTEIPDQRYDDDWRAIQEAYWDWWMDRSTGT